MGQTCPLGSQLRPDVIWFGEQVRMMDAARNMVSSADMLIVVGILLAVYPAAFLARDAPAGAEIMLVDPDAVEGRIPRSLGYPCKSMLSLKEENDMLGLFYIMLFVAIILGLWYVLISFVFPKFGIRG